MADPVNGGSGSQPPKEMSMEVRLLIAFLLMGAVMFVSQYFLKSQAPPPGQKTAETAVPGEKKDAGAPTDAPPAAAPEQAPHHAKVEAASAPGATPERSLPNLTIETDLYKVNFSNQGGTVRSWVLKN